MKKNGDIDLLLVNAPGRDCVYQVLANEFAASEPPIWAGLIANFIRNNNCSVAILDAAALCLSFAETVSKIIEYKPLLVVFVVYGQHPSASTQCMPAAGKVCTMLKDAAPDIRVLFMGTHPSALPARTLKEETVDFVCNGEGPYTILWLLKTLKANSDDFKKVDGLCYRDDGNIVINKSVDNIKDLDHELPGIAWDLLPMDTYKAHNWHCWDQIHARQPYASLYTSLGCPYKCSFCCINAPFGKRGVRYFSAELVIKEIAILVNKFGVKNIKFADEMFVLHPKHVMSICDLIIERKYDLNIWAYARIDTMDNISLERMKQAGFNWLGLGIESGSSYVRKGVEKGRFDDKDIIDIVRRISDAGIYVGANYIFGLPDDTLQSMQKTLDLAIEINSEWANFYSTMAYPGSALHKTAMEQNIMLPENPGGPGWIGYSQYAFEALPLPTDTVSAGEVLSFRDRAFDQYFTNEKYLNMMHGKFGGDVVTHIKHMTSHSLKRKYATPIGE